MQLETELAPLPLVASDLSEPAMSIAEAAALLGVSPADVVDFMCREAFPLPAVYSATGGVSFYRSEVDCWLTESGGTGAAPE